MTLTRRAPLVLAAVGLMLGLHWAYAAFISPRFLCCGFGPIGYPDLGPVWWLKPVAGLCALIPLAYLPDRYRGPSTVVQWMMYALVVVPFATIGPYLLQVRASQVVWWVVLLVLGQTTLWLTTLVPLFEALSRGRVPERLFWPAIALFSAIVYAYTFYRLDFDLTGFTSIGDARGDLRDTVEGTGNAVILAVGWQSAVINPMLIAYGFYRSRWSALGAGLAGQFLLFGLTGFKSIAVSIALIVVLVLARAKSGSRFGAGFLGLLATGVLSASLWTWVTGGTAFIGLAVRRLLVVPGQLIAYYFEFFSSNPTTRLGHSILARWVDYPYDLDLPYLIGRRYFGSAETHVNANVWSDGFANFGITGVITVSLLLGVGLYLIDSAAIGRHQGIVTVIMAVPAFTTAASPLVAATAFNLLPAGILILALPVFAASPPEAVLPGSMRRLLRAVRE